MQAKVLLGVALAATITIAIQAELVLVYTINRHGARDFLLKASTLRETDTPGGPSLLPQGQRQCYNAGLDFYDRYMKRPECQRSNTCLTPIGSTEDYGSLAYRPTNPTYPGYHRLNTLVRSSALDRTIMSAASFMAGVFPNSTNVTGTSRHLPNGMQLVPIYSVAEPEDYLIRGYTRCDAYQRRLDQWYDSAEFTIRAADSEATRAAAAAAMPWQPSSLETFWNMYDALGVWTTYGAGHPPQANISRDNLTRVQQLANWLETSKMRSSMAGNLLGGALLGDMLHWLQQAVVGIRTGETFMKLLVLSGHYNTQLGLLAALELDRYQGSDRLPWFTSIPSFAATLTLELHLHEESGAFLVRLVMQDGPGMAYLDVPLPCATGAAEQALATPGACLLDDFVDWVRPKAFLEAQDWCEACGTTSTTACKLNQSTKWRLTSGGVASIVLGIVLFMALSVAGYLAWDRWQQHRASSVLVKEAAWAHRYSKSYYAEDPVVGPPTV